MQNLPTLRQMQYLVALDDHKSFQKAAQNCAVTQSTLSGGIKDMEDTLRSPVIDRTDRRRVKLTPLGEEILTQARAIITQMESLTARAKGADTFAWPIRLGVIPTIAPYLLPKILKPLQRALPKLELHIHELRSAPLVDKIHDGTLDLALMAFPFDTKGLEQKTLFTEDFVLAAPPGAFKNKSAVTLKDLQDEKLLLLEDGHCLRDHALESCKTMKLSDSKTFSASSLSTLIQMVHQGYGVTLLPAMATETMLPRNLTLRKIKGEAPSRIVGLAWKKARAREKDIAMIGSVLKKTSLII